MCTFNVQPLPEAILSKQNVDKTAAAATLKNCRVMKIVMMMLLKMVMAMMMMMVMAKMLKAMAMVVLKVYNTWMAWT